MMLGTAMFTIVVSTMIMSTPAQTTARTTHGLAAVVAARIGIRWIAATSAPFRVLGVAQEGAYAGHHAAAHGDLDQRAVEWDLEEAPAHPGDGDQLHPHHDVGELQRRRGVADQEGESVESSTDEGRHPGQAAADQRAPPP